MDHDIRKPEPPLVGYLRSGDPRLLAEWRTAIDEEIKAGAAAGLATPHLEALRSGSDPSVSRRANCLETILTKLAQALDESNAAVLAERSANRHDKAREHEARRLTLEELAESQRRLRLLQRSETLGRLVGTVAHDFNNLLSVIINFTTFAMEELEDGTQPADDLARALGAAERAVLLSRRLLLFSRRDDRSVERVDVGELVTELGHMLRPLMGELIHLSIEVQSSVVAAVDSGELEQVITNLAVNARDAMPDGGELVLTVAATEAADGAPTVTLRVVDNGAGMSPEVISRATEPFFTTKPKGSGTGFGLSTVRDLVELAGGSLELFSSPGRGTEAVITLPRVLTQLPVPAPRGHAPQPQLPPLQVLVVEDEQEVRAAIARILEAAGAAVIVAETAGKAEHLLETRDLRVDVLLTDLVMPGMSGDRLAATGKRLRPALKVILLTGYDLPASEVTGIDGLLQKPVHADSLIKAVAQCMSPVSSRD